MIAKILVGLAASLAFFGIGFFAIAMSQPTDFVVERAVVVDAPPQEVFALVEDLQSWQQWSHLAGGDREVSILGTGKGKGAILEWSGTGEVGAGRVTILESQVDESIELELEFLHPVRSRHRGRLSFKPVNGTTHVTWAAHTEMSVPMKFFMPSGPMEKTLGADQEESLRRLGALLGDGV